MQPPWAQFNGTEHYISIATEVCSLLLSVKWFFMTLDIICEESPVSVLYHCVQQWRHHHLGTVSYSRCGAYYLRLPCVYCLSYHAWKFRSTA